MFYFHTSVNEFNCGNEFNSNAENKLANNIISSTWSELHNRPTHQDWTGNRVTFVFHEVHIRNKTNMESAEVKMPMPSITGLNINPLSMAASASSKASVLGVWECKAAAAVGLSRWAKKMAQNGKLMPNLDQQSTKMLNLTVLQRIDPFVEEILFTAAHVTFYDFNLDQNQWVLTLYPRPLPFF